MTVTSKMEGKKVRCPKCKAIVQVPDRDDADANDEADKKEAKAEARLRRKQLAASRRGLTFYRWKFILYLAALFAYLLAFILVPVVYGLVTTAQEQRSNTLIDLANFAIRVLGYCAGFGLLTTFLLAPLLGIIGGSFLVRVPSESGARGLAMGALALDIVPVACGGVGIALGAFSVNPIGDEISLTPIILTISASLAIVAGFTLFMLCVSKYAAYMMDSATARDAILYMVYYLLAIIAGPLLIAVTAGILSDSLMSRAVILFAMVLSWMIVMIRQLLRNLAVIDTIRGRL